MENQNPEYAKGWTYAIALTIILAGFSAFLVVNRHEFFQEMYKQQEHVEEPQVEPDSLQSDTQTH